MTRLAVCLAAFGDGHLESALVPVRRLGLSAVDLPLDTTLALRPTPRRLGDRDIEQLAREVRDAGIEVLCVSNSRDCQLILGPHGSQTDPVMRGTPAQKRRHGMTHAIEAIETASALGCPFVRLFLGCPDFSHWLTWRGATTGWGENVEALAVVLEQISETARAEGVQLCLEPHPKQAIFDRPSTDELLERVGGGVGICLDPANLLALGHDPVSFVEELGQAPVMVHAKDVERAEKADPPGSGWVRYGPQPPVRFRSAGWGEVRWEALMTALLERRFDGPVFIEHEDVVLEREDSIRVAVEIVSRLLASTSDGRRTW